MDDHLHRMPEGQRIIDRNNSINAQTVDFMGFSPPSRSAEIPVFLRNLSDRVPRTQTRWLGDAYWTHRGGHISPPTVENRSPQFRPCRQPTISPDIPEGTTTRRALAKASLRWSRSCIRCSV
jgi:hypothetical protein